MKLDLPNFLTPEFSTTGSRRPSQTSLQGSLDDSDLHIRRNVVEPYISLANLNRRILQLEQKDQKIKSNQLFIDIKEIKASSTKLYLDCLTPKSSKNVLSRKSTQRLINKQKDIYANYLDRIAVHYDTVRNLAKTNKSMKEEELPILEKYRNIKGFENIVESIKNRLIRDHEIGGIFLKADNDFMNAAIDYMCRSARNRYLHEQLKKSNFCIKVKDQEFSRIISIVKDELRVNHINADDIEKLIKFIGLFEEDIVFN